MRALDCYTALAKNVVEGTFDDFLVVADQPLFRFDKLELDLSDQRACQLARGENRLWPTTRITWDWVLLSC
jgi:hypothetical protein